MSSGGEGGRWEEGTTVVIYPAGAWITYEQRETKEVTGIYKRKLLT